MNKLKEILEKSIGAKLVFGTACIVTIISFLLTLLVAFYITTATTKRFVDSSDKDLELVANTIDIFIADAFSSLTMLADIDEMDDIHPNMSSYLQNAGDRALETDTLGLEIERGFRGMRVNYETYVDVFLGTKYGGFIFGSNDPLEKGYDPRARPWYSEPFNNPNTISVSPVYESTTGNPVFTISRSAPKGEAPLGVIGIDVTLTDISHIIESLRIGREGFTTLIQGDGVIIANPLDTTLNFQKMQGEYEKIFRQNPGSFTRVLIQDKWYLGYLSPHSLENASWQLVGFISVRELMQPIIKTIIGLVVGIILIIVTIIFFIHRYLKKIVETPLKSVRDAIHTVGEGDFGLAISHDRKDEIGDIQQALTMMVFSLQEKASLAEKIASGDLRDGGTPISKKDELGYALQKMVANLNRLMWQVEDSVNQVTSGSDQLAIASNSLSDGATMQAASVEEISTSLDEVNTTLAQSVLSADKANSLASASREMADKGATQMDEMLKAMAEINHASQEIAKIMKVIDDIAFQTNLLALNAAVEAARAGSYGKGFAVVAEEVRNLAQSSAKASTQTAQYVEKGLETINFGNSIAEDTFSTFTDIVEKISGSTTLVSNLVESSRHESQAVSEISLAVGNIANITQQNAAGAEESAATSTELLAESENLRAILQNFTLQEKSHG